MSEVLKYKALGEMTQRSIAGGAKWVRLKDYDAAQSELAAVRRRESIIKEKLADCENSEAALREELTLTQRQVTANWNLVESTREELSSICSMACMLEDREWAEHAGKGPVAEKMEYAITEMHNELTAAGQRNADAIRLLSALYDATDMVWPDVADFLTMNKPTESGASDKCLSDGGTCGLGGTCHMCPHK
jgi:hypothetical protein